MKAPGTAYKNHPELGNDPQPDHMDRYNPTLSDNQGVHINSGIPNKAFYEAAIRIGGNAWEAAGQIWYKSLRASVSNTNFQQFANTTFLKAGEETGVNSVQQRAVRLAWEKVGIEITVPIAAPAFRYADGGGRGDDCASLKQQIEALSAQVKALAREVESQSHKGRK